MKGRKHAFLGMDIEFCENTSVKLCTKECIAEAIEQFIKDVSKYITAPANLGSSSVNEESPTLNLCEKDNFHSIVAKLLWVMKHGRPAIETNCIFMYACCSTY